MKNLVLLVLTVLFSSCHQQQLDENTRINASEIDGYWENDQQLIAVWDTVMLHPVHKFYGVFPFTIKQDSLIIHDKAKAGTSAEILKLDSDSLIFMYRDSTLRYSRAKPVNSDTNFESIHLKAGPCNGACPVFELRIKGNGEVVHEGNQSSESEEKLYGQLPLPLLKELNNFLGYIDFQNYHEADENELFPIAGNPELDLNIKFEDDKVFEVNNGVFAGKYKALPKMLYRFHEVVNLKNKVP